MEKGKKGNIHEEGMSFGSRPSSSSPDMDGWIEEDFGKPADGSVQSSGKSVKGQKKEKKASIKQNHKKRDK